MQSKNNWKAWLYLAPVLILMAIFTFYPIINTIGISFLRDYDFKNATSQGFTIDNYLYVLNLKPITDSEIGQVYVDTFVKEALPNTLLITFVTVPISIIVALLISIALNSIKFLKKIFQTIFFVPYVTNAIAIGMVFAVIFNQDYGIFNSLFHLDTAWIFTNHPGEAVNYWNGFFALSFYIVWHSLAYKILIFIGGLQNIDGQYYDAAKIDGAPKWKTIWKITVPLLSPQILYVMITSFIGSFKEYNSVIAFFGTEGGFFDINTGPRSMKTAVYYIYEKISDKQPSLGAAAAVILFVIILVFTGIQSIVSKKRVHY